MAATEDHGPRLRTGTLAPTDVVHAVGGLASHEVPGGRVIIGPAGEPVTLSTSAAAIYDAIDGTRAVAALAAPVARHFEVAEDEVAAVVVPVVRRFGALGLLSNVEPVSLSPEQPDERDIEDVDPISSVLQRPEDSSCVAQRFDLDRATLFNVRAPTFELGIGAAGDEMVEAVESLLGPFLVDTPLPLGLMLVSPARERDFVEPISTIFDGSGYRAWRGRGDAALRSYLLALLSPLGATEDYPRCFVDYRSVHRDGQVILVHPYVLDNARLMIECRQTGWEPLPRLYSEVDCRTQEVVLRAPFDPAAPDAMPAIEATYPVVGIHYGISSLAPEPVYALESLVRRHLAIADGRTAPESLPVLGDIASRVPSAVAAWPGSGAYVQSLRQLSAQIEGAVP